MKSRLFALLALFVGLTTLGFMLADRGKEPAAATIHPKAQSEAGDSSHSALVGLEPSTCANSDRRTAAAEPADTSEMHAEGPAIPDDLALEEELAIEEVSPEDLPPDPLETGSCELMLTLVDTETQRPLEGQVELWRLDAPGNEHWLAGDRIQDRAHVGRAGRRFVGLPEGRYRAVCKEQRAQEPDPDEFSVRGTSTTHTLRLSMPREFRVFVDVYDSTGLLVHEALQSAPTEIWSSGSPDWAHLRTLRNETVFFDSEVSTATASGAEQPVFSGPKASSWACSVRPRERWTWTRR